MKKYIDILTELEKLQSVSSNTDESWGYTRFNGAWNADFLTILKETESCFTNYSILSTLTITIDNTVTPISEVFDYSRPDSFTEWKININKEPLINDAISSGVQYNFFLRGSSFEKWITGINPIDINCPVNNENLLHILVKDLVQPFGGPLLYFTPPDEEYATLRYTIAKKFPAINEIREQVYFVTDFQATPFLPKFLLTDGEFSSSLAQTMLKVSATVFAAAIPQEYYPDKIIVDGIKRTELLLKNNEPVNFTFFTQLTNLVSWLYEDRVQTRKKLFADRLTLEIQTGDTLVAALQKNINESFIQAKERYNFVILDRKDAYVKELKDLLKDLRTQSDLYATKTRTLVSNLLRDVLAGLVLVGFTLFTKIGDNTLLQKNNFIQYVFIGLGVYYLVSLVIQVTIDLIDMNITRKELAYWKNATKELLPDAEFEDHRINSLKDRRQSFNWSYFIIGVIYVVIAICCFKYPSIFSSLVTS